ncbi:PDZ domain-containing protein [Paenibacillus segetis]|uniref:Cell division topological determinant MinJ n=1 Tax=Paenibacillus segetis TaxID=1325360 RepID=A0ABQ1YQR5_9BACL|nr:PDZ domain-containing protein [Paenibacillus segetis]GGH33248.1 cell division topological determinant MinJ [Paenibacillus segetis]
MSILLEGLWNLAEAGAQLFLQPFYYISIILIMLIYRRQVLLERKLFHVRLHSWVSQTWRTVLGGLLAGIGVSSASAFLGMTLSVEGIVCIWVVTLVLLLFRIRYLCMAYSVGLLGVTQFILNLFPAFEGREWMGDIVRIVRELNIPALLCLVALLHVAEGLLVRWQGANFAGPLFFEGKRGRLVGGYQMQNLWPIPLFLLIPAQTTGGVLPWTPFFGGESWQGGFGMMALPIVIGFSEMTIGLLPQAKARVTSGRILGYGVIILVLAMLSAWWSPLVIVAALAAIILHEGLVLFSRIEEQQHSPLFVNPKGGLKVLAVLPGSPAEELGIVAGETIAKVNGVKVPTKEDLHAALRINPAFCKLEVLNLAGESKYLQRAIYAGEHHQLGAILAPDEKAPAAMRLQPLSLLQLLRPKRGVSDSGSVTGQRQVNTKLDEQEAHL